MKTRLSKPLALFLVLSLLLLQTVLALADARVQGLKVSSPRSGRGFGSSLPVEGTAWIEGDAGYRIEVKALGPEGSTVTDHIPREAVVYGGETAFLLSSFRGMIRLPDSGEWTIMVSLIDSDDRRVSVKEIPVIIGEGFEERAFRHFSTGHFAGLFGVLLLCLLIPTLVRGASGPGLQGSIEYSLAIIIWLNEIVYQLYWYLSGGWTAASALMLQMCGLSILMILVVFSLSPGRSRRILYELIFFWGIGGALQALIAPDIGYRGFPDYKYFAFFLSHGLILASGVYIVAARGFRPTLFSILRVVLISNAVLFCVYFFNLLLERFPPFQRGNYFVTGYPPPTGSVIDLFAELFGPAPRYLIGIELLGLAVFLILWLPFGVVRLFSGKYAPTVQIRGLLKRLSSGRDRK